MSKLRSETESLHLPLYVLKNPDKIKKGSFVLNPRKVYTVYCVIYIDKISVILLSKNGDILIDALDKYANVLYPFVPENDLLTEINLKNKKFIISHTMYNFFEKITNKKSKEYIFKETYKNASEGIDLKIKIYISKYKFENTSISDKKSSSVFHNDLGCFTIPLKKDIKFYIGIRRTYQEVLI
jgi:hypothetical protein